MTVVCSGARPTSASRRRICSVADHSVDDGYHRRRRESFTARPTPVALTHRPERAVLFCTGHLDSRRFFDRMTRSERSFRAMCARRPGQGADCSYRTSNLGDLNPPRAKAVTC